jgi:hypothetical protein
MHIRRTLAMAVVLLMVAACTVAWATEATPAPAAQESVWSKLFDSTFGLILLFIFLPVMVTTFIAARQRDRCLKTFDKFHATIITKKNQPIWGVLRVYSKGLVTRYRQPVSHPPAPAKSSYMFYEPELANVFAIFRFHDQIDIRNQRRRMRQIQALAYPGFFRRQWRRVRNFINTLRDAFNKAIGAILGQMQRAKPSSQMLKMGGREIEGIGSELLGKVANAYEPLLEHCIGNPVVIDVTGPPQGDKPGPTQEYAGQLGEYSSAYLMVLDIEADFEATATVDGASAFDEGVQLHRRDDRLEVANGLSVAVRAVSLLWGGRTHTLDMMIPAGQTAELPVSLAELTPAPSPSAEDGEAAPPAPPVEAPQVSFVARRQADLMVPRTHAVVRHGGVRREGANPVKSFRLHTPRANAS